MRKRTFLSTLAVGGLAPAWPALAQSDLVRIVIPLTPGTTPDTIARVISMPMQERLKSSVMVDNRPGASGMIGMGLVARSPDSNVLLMVPATTLTLPHFYKTIDFDVLHAFTPITRTVSSAFVLAISNGTPVNSLPEFVAWAKAQPGAFYGSPGSGTHHHLFMEMLLQNLGIRLVHVPYRGSAPALTDLIGGQVSAMFLPIQIAAPLRDAGSLKIIGGSLRERHPNFPDIPSLDELGAKNYNADPWYAVWGGPKVSAGQAEKYRQAIIASLNLPDARKILVQKEGMIIKTSTPGELQQMAQAESDMWDHVIESAHIQPQ